MLRETAFCIALRVGAEVLINDKAGNTHEDGSNSLRLFGGLAGMPAI